MIDTSPPDSVGPYRLLHVLKRGGQGTVYRGYDDRLQRQVAIKLYSQPSGRVERKQLLREAQLVAVLDSPRMVKVFDVVVTKTHVALIMEYVPGCDLEDLLSAVDLSLHSILVVAADIASALATARQAGIVHGDVKASNILVTREGRAKLTDFGIAHSVAEESDSAGSPSAVAPEQYLGESCDVRTDLFALGCLLHRMLSGEHAFFSEGRLDSARLMAAERPVLDEFALDGSEIGEPLRNLVAGLLQVRPEMRPENTHEVRRVIRSVKRSLPLQRSNTLRDEARPWFRRDQISLPPDEARNASYRPPPPRVLSVEFWKRLWARYPRRLAATIAFVSLGVAISLWVFLQPERVHFTPPVYSVSSGAVIPRRFDVDTVRAALMAAASKAFERVEFSGEGVTIQRTFSTAPAPDLLALSDEHLDIFLRCNRDVCLLDLVRNHDRDTRTAQVTLLSDDGAEHWQRATLRAANSLYADR